MKKKTKIILKLTDLRGEVLFKCRDFRLAEDIGVKIEKIIDLLDNSVIVDKKAIGVYTKIESNVPPINEHRLISTNSIRTDNEFFNNKCIEKNEYDKVRNLIKEDLLSSLEEEIEDESN